MLLWNFLHFAAYGPANWKLQWSNCSGLRQSPIDIATVGVIAKQAPWKLQAGNPDPAIAENFIVMGKLINNGRGLGFRVDDVNTPIQLVFNNTYKLRQFHFHFGCEDEMGSEHSLDGKRYPGEVCLRALNAIKFALILILCHLLFHSVPDRIDLDFNFFQLYGSRLFWAFLFAFLASFFLLPSISVHIFVGGTHCIFVVFYLTKYLNN